MNIVGVIVTVILASCFLAFWIQWIQMVRSRFIQAYQFPPGLWQGLTRTYPQRKCKLFRSWFATRLCS